MSRDTDPWSPNELAWAGEAALATRKANQAKREAKRKNSRTPANDQTDNTEEVPTP